MRTKIAMGSVLGALMFLLWAAPCSAAGGGQALNDPAVRKSFDEAKGKLQAGVNTWNREVSNEARDLFISCLVRTKAENAYLNYYVALADFWLATYAIASDEKAECGRMAADGLKYLEKALAIDPSFAEAEALSAYLLGMQVAVEPEQAVILGMKSMQLMEKALAADPGNPGFSSSRDSFNSISPKCSAEERTAPCRSSRRPSSCSRRKRSPIR